MMQDKIFQFLNNPFPLWENDLTSDLVNAQLIDLSQYDLDLTNYSTEGSYFGSNNITEKKPVLIYGTLPKNYIFLEYPQLSSFNFFYEDHGLEPEYTSNISDNTINKLKSAFQVFNLIPSAEDCISSLVKRVQILKQSDDEMDTSYSHPKIPFSIFVSLCNDSSIVSNLRVAESILHEAMHLKLTLIEKHIDLIKPNSSETFYSPWRDEQRPLRGVLHGLFVFRAVLEMYKFLFSNIENLKNINHISYRIEDIEKEINLIKELSNSDGLTVYGEKLCSNLLQFCSL